MVGLIKSTDIHGREYGVPVDQLVWRPAAYAIVIRDGKILLTKQHGKFHLPGGGVELGEMPQTGVLREVQEETGIDVGNPRLVGHISGFFTQTWQNRDDVVHVHSILLYFRCDFVGGALSMDGFEDEEKAIGDLPQWIPLEELGTIAAGSTVDWRSIVRQALGMQEALSEARRRGLNIGACVRILNDRDEVLLIKRTTNDYFGNVWELPGGSIAAGEDVRAAAAREVFEETGLTVDPNSLEYVTFFDFENIETGKHKRKFAFSVRATADVAISHEHSGYMWASADRVREMKLQSQHAQYELWDDHFQITMSGLGA